MNLALRVVILPMGLIAAIVFLFAFAIEVLESQAARIALDARSVDDQPDAPSSG
jgi:hypothetical protein